MLAALSGLCEPARAIRAAWSTRLPPGVEFPPSFAEAISVAIALEDADPRAGRQVLEMQWLDLMPRHHLEQRTRSADPQRTLFHTPLDLGKMPRLSSAIEGWSVLSGERVAIDGRTLAEVYGDRYFGACMPMLYGWPADIAAMGRALSRDPVHAVLDRWMAAPLAHEITHGRRHRDALFPYLDECVAGHLSVRVLPEFAFPAPGESNGIMATPWLAQVGHALARICGEQAIAQAQRGDRSWDEVLPRGFREAATRLGFEELRVHRDPHFLRSNYTPMRWCKLAFLAASGAPQGGITFESLDSTRWIDIPAGHECEADLDLLLAALRAMCVRNFRDGDTWRMARIVPHAPITVDLRGCRVTTAPGLDGFDPHRLEHLFPPAMAARLRTNGVTEYVIQLRSLDALDALARAIRDDAGDRDGEHFSMVRR